VAFADVGRDEEAIHGLR